MTGLHVAKIKTKNATGRAMIVAIGQYPPPMTGLNYVMMSMTDRLKQSWEVAVANIGIEPGDAGLRKFVRRIGRILKAICLLVAFGLRPAKICYVGCEGHLGLLFTLLIVAAARALRYDIVLHHHSFNYINSPSFLMRAVLLAGGAHLTHIFLCSRMHERFQQCYGLEVRGRVISNAAFVDDNGEAQIDRKHGSLVIGLLSNLTPDKGLYDFLDLLREAARRDLNIRGVLAGPAVRSEDRAAIVATMAELGSRLEYRGPLYGSDKTKFYAGIDVFVFPTRYRHEAQPVVIFEALAAGSLVAAYNRGCIEDQIGAHGLVVPRDAIFTSVAIDWIGGLLSDRAELEGRRLAARSHFAAKRAAALKAFDSFFELGGKIA